MLIPLLLQRIALVTVLCCAWLSAAHAQVWGYVDEKGVAHLATEKLDDRYTLFMQAQQSTTINTKDGLPVPGTASATSKTPLPPVYDRLHQRLISNPNIGRTMPLVQKHAKQHGLDPFLVKAVIAVESSFETTAVSPKGAVGLMQVIPPTAMRFGVSADKKRSVEQKLKDPNINIAAGTRYLAFLLDRFNQNRTLALAAYNAGEGAVERYGNKIPPFPETQNYVRLVDQFYTLYAPPPPKTNEVKRIRMQIPGRGNMPASLGTPPMLPNTAPASGVNASNTGVNTSGITSGATPAVAPHNTTNSAPQ